jgi:hypothetical protein
MSWPHVWALSYVDQSKWSLHVHVLVMPILIISRGHAHFVGVGGHS